MGQYGICRLDLMKGHAYHYDFDQPIENGVLAEIDYTTGKIAVTSDPTKRQVLVASVANLYDSLDESDFRNEVGGMQARTYDFEVGDIFTTTQIAYEGDRANFGAIVKGDYAYATVGGKFTVASTFPTTNVPAQKFRVIEKTQLNGKEAIALQVEIA
ncbi:hypothetical protein [Bacillus smithii]|uniref:hypothetical protein n=1 Tax=Bacillus smithii TaxID=1479 RepID=UPI003D261729